MKLKLILVAFFTFGAVLSAQTPSPTVAGKWMLPLETPHGKVVLSLDLKVDGKKVSGTMTSEQGPLPVTGEFAEGRLRFVATIDDGELVFAATLKDADTLVGILSNHVGDLKGTATRVKTK